MRFYLDTEFNGFGGELISLALISPDGPQMYSGVQCLALIDPWVSQHVMPVLRLGTMWPKKTFRSMFHAFITQFKNPEIICDWHADAGYFCDLLAGEDYGSSLDFECRITILKTPPGQPVSLLPHNALEDARALMVWHVANGAMVA